MGNNTNNTNLQLQIGVWSMFRRNYGSNRNLEEGICFLVFAMRPNYKRPKRPRRNRWKCADGDDMVLNILGDVVICHCKFEFKYKIWERLEILYSCYF